MTSSLTDRYVSATVRDLDEPQRADVERELRTTIADMVEARVASGGADPDTAEREVLLELGDPMRLAADYSGRPLYLIGPRVFPQWRRVVTVLLCVLVPAVTAVNLVVRLFVEDVTTQGLGPAVTGALLVGAMVAVNVAFWVTLVFALAERGRVSDVVPAWDPGQLPRAERAAGAGLGDTVTEVVLVILIVLALVWQQTSSPFATDGARVPVLDPGLWSSWMWVLIAAALTQAVLAVLAYRAGRWTVPLGVGSVVADLTFALTALALLRQDALLDERFVDVLVRGGWEEAQRDLTIGTTLGVLLVVTWSIVETVGRVRAGRAAERAAERPDPGGPVAGQA